MLRYPQKIKAIEPDNADIYMGVSINKYRWISDMVMGVADMKHECKISWILSERNR
jgi:hypothetical protein